MEAAKSMSMSSKCVRFATSCLQILNKYTGDFGARGGRIDLTEGCMLDVEEVPIIVVIPLYSFRFLLAASTPIG